MKKFGAIIIAVLMIAMSFAVNVSAHSSGIVENPPISVPNATPTVDGVVNGDEGWSVAALMNAETLGYYWRQNPLTSDGNVLFAWDADGLYFAAKIVEGLEAHNEITGEDVTGINDFIYSTGEDWIDVSDTDPTEHYGYDGDIFGLMLDPQGLTKADYDTMPGGLLGNGFANDYTPWYLVGLFEGDVAKMYRQKINKGDITDQVDIAGRRTENGWEFEAKLPWDMIIDDIEAISFGDVALTVEDITQNTGVIRAAGMYQDRFEDPEAGEVDTWGRYVTAPTTQFDGTPGNMGSGDVVQALGITLVLENEGGDTTSDTTEAPDSTDDTTTAPVTDDITADNGGDNTTADNGGDDTTKAPETTIVDVTDDKGNVVTDDKGNKVTEKVTVKEEETETAIVDVTDDKGNVVTDAKGNKVTEKVTVKKTSSTTKAGASTTKKPTTGASTGGDAAQTFDIGIAIALGALATSGIGIAATKKRK